MKQATVPLVSGESKFVGVLQKLLQKLIILWIILNHIHIASQKIHDYTYPCMFQKHDYILVARVSRKLCDWSLSLTCQGMHA